MKHVLVGLIVLAALGVSSCQLSPEISAPLPQTPQTQSEIQTSTPAPTADASYLQSGHIAFTAHVQLGDDPSPHGLACRIMAMNADGTNISDLTPSNGTCNQAPAYSPDGKWIAYLEGVDLFSRHVILMQADGTNAHNLINHSFQDTATPPVWSLDGQRLAIFEPRQKREPYFLMSRDGKELGRTAELSPHEWLLPNFSPDGRQKASPQPCTPKLPRPKLPCIYPAEATHTHTGKPFINRSGLYREIAWSPVGDKIAFSTGFVVYVMNADQTSVQMLVRGTNPSWQP